MIDHFISIDHSKKNLKIVRSKVSSENRYLVLRESRSVKPDQFKSRNIRKYKYVFSCARTFDEKIATHFYNDGFLLLERHNNNSISRPEKSICLVNENKFSLHKSANYSLRQHAIKQLIKSDFKITIAGENWKRGYSYYVMQQIKSIVFLLKNLTLFDIRKIRKPFRRIESNHCNFVGFVDNKITFMNGFRYALIIENDNYRPTEKIFDALKAGCIPIYFGPMFAPNEVPSDIFIRIDTPEGFANLIKQLKNLTEYEYVTMRARGQTWISSDTTYDRWSIDKVMSDLSSSIKTVIFER